MFEKILIPSYLTVETMVSEPAVESPVRIAESGTDVMIFKIFLLKIWRKIGEKLAKNWRKICEKLSKNWRFWLKTKLNCAKI
jgi:hypothetical protein